jgi:Protein of unknown function (DUF3253)
MSLSLDPVIPHLNRLLNSRSFPKTICPSEAARALSAAELKESGTDNWRDLMPAIRGLAFEWRDCGILDILQKGQVLPETQALQQTVGPIRLRKKHET